MAEHYGLQTAQGHLTVTAESKEPYAEDVLAQLREDAALVIARYPQKRSALLPLLHLVQSVDGYVTGRGIDLCAELLDLETAEVSGVATFYTQYKRHPNGEYTVGVCTNTLCAIMGGDQIWDAVSEYLGVGHDETTPDGKVTLERVECNAACDYAPVVMANWEFFDNQTPESTRQLVDDLRDGKPVRPTRGADSVCTFKQMSRVLAGFTDGRADEGVGAGPASLNGLELAHRRGWVAPGEDGTAPASRQDQDEPGDGAGHRPAADRTSADTKPEGEKPGDQKASTTAVEPTAKPAGSDSAPHAGTGDASTPAGPTDTTHPEGGKDGKDGKDKESGGDKGVPDSPSVLPEPHVDESATADSEVAGAMPPSLQAQPKAPNFRPVPTPEPQPHLYTPLPGQNPNDDPSAPEAPFVASPAAVRAASAAPAVPAESSAPAEPTAPAAYGPGSAAPEPDGSGPAGWEVKGNASSKVFHTPDSPWYRRTKAEVWFRDAEAALAAGFTDALEGRRDGDTDGKDEA